MINIATKGLLGNKVHLLGVSYVSKWLQKWLIGIELTTMRNNFDATKKMVICARSVRPDLEPNIFPSGPPTQSINTYSVRIRNAVSRVF